MQGISAQKRFAADMMARLPDRFPTVQGDFMLYADRCSRLFIASLLWLGLAAGVSAEEVSLVGVFPGKALVVIDGAAPRALAAGQSQGGVKIISVERDSAVVEINGKRSKLNVGENPVALGGGERGQVVLAANAQGHYLAEGAINGAAVSFLVDTGATSVALSTDVAVRAGIAYTRGARIAVSTANGATVAWRVKLDTVTLRGLTLRNVEGVVMPASSPVVLLGMSFLNRMEMKRDGNSMVLTQRY
ncbi:MAG: hypothetical protein RJA63_2047 [Pseudomonadota bacterium]|jgi:aspartyl protease family protein